jgi:NADH-quinone oxidoreductase subunit F
MQMGEMDEKGRRKPVRIPESEFGMQVDYVLVAIGEAPDPSFLPPDTAIEVAPWGGLLTNPTTLATGLPGVFAAGDATYGPKTIIHAAAHGRKAARSIHAYLSGYALDGLAEMPDDETETASPLPSERTITLDLRPTPRAIMPLTLVTTNRATETANGLSEEEARREAKRCLRCDLAYLCPTIYTVSASAGDTPAVMLSASPRAR